ncbi:hypothetical protein BDK51DRAFT_42996 [Blyttiomyces helicus]|uniref:Uncharacterized protein n=1 Tax=Blyttiomyces helicus TaxID=388810 RepID=A0A4P9VX91_9FUNG|nr:hypothetical protein BDK51DRAFT_42996 [Blyttiomyces helicus]|eukprot:RKO82898.1 hypothetical protein BDK51DRAFT_42996 [Blyttiomyces helicus]
MRTPPLLTLSLALALAPILATGQFQEQQDVPAHFEYSFALVAQNGSVMAPGSAVTNASYNPAFGSYSYFKAYPAPQMPADPVNGLPGIAIDFGDGCDPYPTLPTLTTSLPLIALINGANTTRCSVTAKLNITLNSVRNIGAFVLAGSMVVNSVASMTQMPGQVWSSNRGPIPGFITDPTFYNSVLAPFAALSLNTNAFALPSQSPIPQAASGAVDLALVVDCDWGFLRGLHSC